MGHTPESRARATIKRHGRRDKWIQENGPCRVCGSWANPEMDHIDPATKDPKLKRGTGLWSWAEARLLVELAKCQVLCSLCHQKKTSREEIDTRRCGKKGYQRGCRCVICTKANNASKQKWRASRRSKGLSYT